MIVYKNCNCHVIYDHTNSFFAPFVLLLSVITGLALLQQEFPPLLRLLVFALPLVLHETVAPVDFDDVIRRLVIARRRRSLLRVSHLDAGARQIVVARSQLHGSVEPFEGRLLGGHGRAAVESLEGPPTFRRTSLLLRLDSGRYSGYRNVRVNHAWRRPRWLRAQDNVEFRPIHGACRKKKSSLIRSTR